VAYVYDFLILSQIDMDSKGFFSLIIQMHVEIFVAQSAWRFPRVIFEKFDEGVFVLKAALRGDLLDRIVGMEQL
jgi:hypothetical protein